ncbi:hypothetical protein PG990_014663 [Apiospora arundinis]
MANNTFDYFSAVLEPHDILTLRQAFREQGNVMLIGYDLPQLQNVAASTLGSPASPKHLILTWYGTKSTFVLSSNSKKSFPSSRDSRVTLWISPPSDTLFSVYVDKHSNYVRHDGTTNVAYLYDKEPRLRAVKLAYVEDIWSQRSTLVFQDDNLHVHPQQTTNSYFHGLKQQPQDNYAESTFQKDLKKARNELHEEKHAKSVLQNELNQARNELQATATTMETLRKNWKKAASQLAQFRSPEIGQYQLPDSDLIKAVYHLRYEIQNFSMQYFAVTSSKQFVDAPNNVYWKYMIETTPHIHGYRDHLKSKVRGENVIQSFLWRLLAGEVFDKFRWVARLQEPMSRIYETLRPDVVMPETDREFQIWKATTSNLIIKRMGHDNEQANREETTNISCSLAKQALNAIRPYLEGSEEKLMCDLQSMIQLSIDLDQDICRLRARYKWIFPPLEESVRFNPDTMAVGTGQVEPRSGESVNMIIAPALIKQGKQTGQDFDVENSMLKMEVTCMS